MTPADLLEKARQTKMSMIAESNDNPQNLVKGSAVGLLIGAGYGFFNKKSVYVYAVLGAIIGGVINGFVIPYAKENV